MPIHQLSLYGERLLVRGEISVIHVDDGRTLIQLEGMKNSPWLELMPEDRRWLIEALQSNPWEDQGQ